MTKGGCPMCRAVMVENVEMGDDDDDDDDEEDLGDDDSRYITDDIRIDESEQENHMLRGIRWLFQQHESEPSSSMFDGNSMEITPNSVRQLRSHPREGSSLDISSNEHENSIDELDEESTEMNWQDLIEESRNKQKEIADLEQFLKEKRNVSYNDLLTTILSIMYREKFDYLELSKCHEKVENILDNKFGDPFQYILN